MWAHSRGLALLCLALALRPSPAAALDPGKALTQFLLDSFQAEQGLPQDTVQAILQTRDGYLWVGTQDGLARFDGVRFRVWDGRSTRALGTGSVLSLLEDRQGRLWIGRPGGISRLEGSRFSELPLALRSGVAVWSFCEGPDGDVFAATSGAGLLRFRGEEVRAFTVADGLPSDSLRSICRDSAGDLWIATSGRGLVRMHGETFEVIDTSKGLSNDFVRAVVADPAGGVWAGTAGGGLHRVAPGPRPVITRVAGLPSDQVSALHVDRAGSVWIGTWGAGIARLRDGRIDVLSSRHGLTNDQVWSLASDREGNVWVGTWIGGLNQLRDGKFLLVTTREGLSSDNTRAVLQTRDGVVWVATAGGGLNRVDGERISALRKADGLPSDEVSSLAEGCDGSLLVGTYTAGAVRLSRGRLAPLAPGLAPGDTRAVLEGRDGTVWLGTAGGLVEVSRGALRLTGPSEVPGLDRVVGLLEDRSGTLWIATAGSGLLRREGDAFRALTTADGLASDRVLALHEDADGVLWIGTAGGLSRLAGGRLRSVSSEDGLFDDLVQTVLDDGLGNLWLTSNRGVSRVGKRDVEEYLAGRLPRVPHVTYGLSDGLRGRSFAGGQQPAALRAGDGRLWFPSYRGLVVVDPRTLREDRPPLAVHVEEVTSGGLAATGGGPFDFAPGTRSVEVRYSAPSFTAPTSLRFRYLLEGVDPDWVEAGGRRRAYYTNLSPGTYTFRVIAQTRSGRGSPDEATAVIRIPPRVHETRAFRLAVAALLVAAAVAGHRLRLDALRRRHDELERVVAERTEELRLANARLEQLAVVDPLTELFNRRRFDELIDEAWRQGARSRTVVALVLFDIDLFKQFNDRHGHLAGDACLRAIAGVIRSAARRSGENAARWGGEEFAILMPGLDARAAAERAEAIRAAVARLGFFGTAGGDLVVTISAGVAAAVPVRGAPPSALLEAADRALYRAKEEGRNRVVIAD